MNRYFESGALYSDLRTTGERVSALGSRGVATHLGVIGLPPGEDALMFLCQTTRGPWKFAGKGHRDGGPGSTWEWSAGVWTEKPPSNGTNGFVYDLAGNLHIIAPGPNVTSQGYRRDANGDLASGDARYGPFKGLSEWAFIDDGLAIGQGDPQHGTPTGIVLWDDHAGVNRLLQAGYCTFIRVDRVGEDVAITFSTPSGCVFLQMTLAELHALPAVAVKPPQPAPVPVPIPVPVPVPQPQPETPTMRLPDGVQTIVNALYTQHLDLANGTDDQRRQLTQLIIEQVVFTYPNDGWVWKSADPNRPLSKDSIAIRKDGRLLNFDLFNGGTRRPNDHPESEDITGQTPRPWPGVDHLGTGVPAPPPTVPPPSTPPPTQPPPPAQPDISDLDAILTALGGTLLAVDALQKRIEELSKQQYRGSAKMFGQVLTFDMVPK